MICDSTVEGTCRCTFSKQLYVFSNNIDIWHAFYFYTNCMTFSDYNTKPVRGDHAIILNCMGSLEITRGQLLNCTVVTAWA